MKTQRTAFALLSAAALLAAGCVPFFPWSASAPATPQAATVGTLDVQIVYVGTWYRETFGYAPNAPNVRHVVLVAPPEVAVQVAPQYVFTALRVLPEGIELPQEFPEMAQFAPYLHEAPNAHLRQELPAATYAVAGAFLVAPLSREEAGVAEDAALWAGVSGGGASSDYQSVTVEAGQVTSLTIILTDADGWG